MRIFRLITEPIRSEPSWEERWQDSDGGLIQCWERGRELATQNQSLAFRAQAGELVSLSWKGGVEADKPKQKLGTLFYLAMWQGVRGQNLDIETGTDTVLKCVKHKVSVTYTDDPAKLSKLNKESRPKAKSRAQK